MNNSPIQWVDSHCHFDFEDFNADRDAIWQACRNNGMAYMLVPGIKPDQWPRLPPLHRAYDGLFYTVGLHPWWITEHESLTEKAPQGHLIDALHAAAVKEACKAIGECGLDTFVEVPMARQEAVLESHLQVAQDLQLPVILHCVRAHNPLIRLLKRFQLARGGVIHAFNGSLQLAQTYQDMGFYLGVGGSITYERANKTRSALAAMPLETLLLETDAPDMPLCGRQGQRNSPANIPLISACLAALRDESADDIFATTTHNFQKLLKLESVI